MNDDRNFERTAQAWLELGPEIAPERVLSAALTTIETMSQQRALRVPWRFPRMTTQTRFLSVAVIGVIVIAVGAYVFRSPQEQIASPGSSPSPTAAATISAPALQTKWTIVGGRGSLIGDPYRSDGSIVIDATHIRFNTLVDHVESRWSLDPNGAMVLDLEASQADLKRDRWQCTSGDIGTYAVSLSATGATLTFSSLADACPTRTTILAGDWSRWPCPNPASRCDPEIAPGIHTATFTANGDPESSPPPTFIGGYSYTVPAGWSGIGTYLWRPTDPIGMSVDVELDMAANSQDPGCPDALEAGVGSSSSALAAWLGGLPGLATTTPMPITIGGYNGLALDVAVNQSWGAFTCDQYKYFGAASQKMVLTLRPGPGGSNSGRQFLDTDGRARYVVLDVATGHNVVIEVKAPDEASWNDLVTAAMPVIETFQFDRGAPQQ